MHVEVEDVNSFSVSVQTSSLSALNSVWLTDTIVFIVILNSP